MRKKILYLLLAISGIFTGASLSVRIDHFKPEVKIVESVKFDSELKMDDFYYVEIDSTKHSKAIGELEWIGEV